MNEQQILDNAPDGWTSTGVGNYEASKTGSVRNKKTGNVLKWHLSNCGYARVCMWVNGKAKMLSVHRIVAKTFISNPEDKRTVNHKDGNKLNNCADNLEWATDSENNKHAWDKGLNRTYNAIPVIGENKHGFGYYFPTMAKCRFKGFEQGNVHRVVNGKRSHCNGFVFQEVGK